MNEWIFQQFYDKKNVICHKAMLELAIVCQWTENALKLDIFLYFVLDLCL